jgi:hypothetical protein
MKLSAAMARVVSSIFNTYTSRFVPAKLNLALLAAAGGMLALLRIPQAQWIPVRALTFIRNRITSAGNAVVALLRPYITQRLFITNQVNNQQTYIVRGRFSETPAPKIRKDDSHSHPDAAAVRDSLSAFATSLAQSSGLTPYYLEMSRADQRKGRRGTRNYYWTKDMAVAPSSDPPKSTDLRVIVDTDYYMDMPAILSERPIPTVIITSCPTTAGSNSKNVSYCFTKEGRLRTIISGSGQYEHELWNYGYETITVRSWTTVTTYVVDRRHVDEHYCAILLTPISKHSWFSKILTYFLSSTPLERLNPVVPGTSCVLLRVKGKDSMEYSLGRVDQFASHNVTPEQFHAINNIARTGSHPISSATISSYIDHDLPRIAGAVLLAFVREYVPFEPPTIFPVSGSIYHYQYRPYTYDPDARPTLIPFMDPFMKGAYAPDKTKGNDTECVQGRLMQVQPTKVRCTIKTEQHMEEFITMFTGKMKHKLHPKTVDDVWINQPRPNQQHTIAEAERTGNESMHVKSFQKAEAYVNANTPRNISTVTPVSKVEYSKYMYAFADHLKTQDWYAFGKTPVEIAGLVASIASKANYILLSDFSRFDGRVGVLMRVLERRIVLNLFHPSYHPQVEQLLKEQIFASATTGCGVRYNTGTSRMSGSAETAAMNSINNAFTNYSALRSTGLKPAEAYAALGIYGGDDGLTAIAHPSDAKKFTKAAEFYGHKLTIDIKRRGEPGVEFLARVFGPDVWNGKPDSICQIRRQLSKFHTSHAIQGMVSDKDKLIEKARAYYLMDRNTPFIGLYLRCVVEILLNEDVTTAATLRGTPAESLRPWHSRTSYDCQFPNDVGEWAVNHVLNELNLDSESSMRAYVREITELAASGQLDVAWHLALHPPPDMVLNDELELKGPPVVINGEIRVNQPTCYSINDGKKEDERKDLTTKKNRKAEEVYHKIKDGPIGDIDEDVSQIAKPKPPIYKPPHKKNIASQQSSRSYDPPVTKTRRNQSTSPQKQTNSTSSSSKKNKSTSRASAARRGYSGRRKR